MRVCVYCSSSALIDKIYFDATEKLALELVKNNYEVIYGGGAIGLMGKLADTVIENGGIIKGIIPKFMNEVEWAHKKLQNIEFTETMHERKAKFLEGIDGLIALPGGSGTLEELFEAITLKRLGLFSKPIIILNTNGYYNSLFDMLNKCVTERFMDERHLDIWKMVDEPTEVVFALENSDEWYENAIEFAVQK